MYSGLKIAMVRESKGITRKKFAEYFNVSLEVIERWENQGVNDEVIISQIAQYLQCEKRDFSLHARVSLTRGENVVEFDKTEVELMRMAIEATPASQTKDIENKSSVIAKLNDLLNVLDGRSDQETDHLNK